MPSPLETRAALQLLTGEAVGTALDLMRRVRGSAVARRAALLDGTPEVIAYYSEGSAALAVDFYEEQREIAGASGGFVPELVVADRTVKIRRGIAWASEPLFDDRDEDAGKRLAEIVQLETARPFRDTITTNTAADPQAIGWKRITSNCCKFCTMLADRGAVYRESTARFAAHPHCDCSAAPAFVVGKSVPEASVLQYRASRRGRTPAQRAELRDYLAANY